jgi:DNA-binding NtrC family response regulator
MAELAHVAGPVVPAQGEHLSRHDWPGNVRELGHFAERCALGLTPAGPAQAGEAERAALGEMAELAHVAGPVVPAQVLADRRGDRRRFNREPPPVTPSIREHLSRHDWPGNVRELGHFAEPAGVRPSAQRSAKWPSSRTLPGQSCRLRCSRIDGATSAA